MIKIQKRVSEYLVVRMSSSARLMDAVNDRIKEGWDIIGGMATIMDVREADGSVNNWFYQTMVKYEEDYYDTSALIDFMENKR